MFQNPCRRCGSIKSFTEVHKDNAGGYHIGLYCADCGLWQRWLNKVSPGLTSDEVEFILGRKKIK